MHSDVSPCPKLPGPVKSPLHIRVAETPRPVSMLPQGQETTALSPIPVTGQTSTRPPGCNVIDSMEQASKEPYKWDVPYEYGHVLPLTVSLHGSKANIVHCSYNHQLAVQAGSKGIGIHIAWITQSQWYDQVETATKDNSKPCT